MFPRTTRVRNYASSRQIKTVKHWIWPRFSTHVKIFTWWYEYFVYSREKRGVMHATCEYFCRAVIGKPQIADWPLTKLELFGIFSTRPFSPSPYATRHTRGRSLSSPHFTTREMSSGEVCFLCRSPAREQCEKCELIKFCSESHRRVHFDSRRWIHQTSLFRFEKDFMKIGRFYNAIDIRTKLRWQDGPKSGT